MLHKYEVIGTSELWERENQGPRSFESTSTTFITGKNKWGCHSQPSSAPEEEWLDQAWNRCEEK